MKRTAFKFLIIATLFLIVGASSAEVMQEQPVLAILKQLKNSGFISVQKIQLVNDEYQAYALNNEGESTFIRINSHDGEIISTVKVNLHITMLEVVEKIESVGYAGITYIESKDNHYDIIAIGPNGKQTRLQVDAVTGALAGVEKLSP